MAKTEKKSDKSLPEEKLRGATTKDTGESQYYSGTGEAGNIEKVRDILFGTQMREYEKRMARQEERMLKEIAGLRDEVKTHFESLENYTKKEVDSLDDQLKAEQGDRSESVKELSSELRASATSFEKKISQLDEQLGKSSRDLRQQILDQSKSLSDEIVRKNEQISTALEQAVQELRADKIDRSALSELLMEIAMRLTGDLAAKLGIESIDPDNQRQ